MWRKAAPAERTFIAGPSCVFGSDYGCNDPPTHKECARYALRVCPHLVAPGSVSVTIATPRYRLRCFNHAMPHPRHFRGRHVGYYWPARPYKHVEWWSEGKVVDRDEFLRALPTKQRRCETPSHNF